MALRSLLSGVGPADIRLEPFPHVSLSDVLDERTWRALSDGFPPFSAIGWSDPSRPPRSNTRYQLSAWQILQHSDMSDVWKRFVALHASPAFFAEVAALFREHWPQALKGELSDQPMGLLLRDGFGPARILQDARIEINTPVTAGPSSSRGPHLDTANRIFSCLYYLRDPQDDAIGGDLELFRWREGPVDDIDAFVLPETAVEKVLTVPYRANQMVIFPQGIDAIHGVSVRQPTPHMRRYVFITAELADPWLFAPGKAPALA